MNSGIIINMKYMVVLLCLIDSVLLRDHECFLGDMTDIQSWVLENGDLAEPYNTEGVDIQKENLVTKLKEEMIDFAIFNRSIRYLSMAKCDLKRIPNVFNHEDHNGVPIHNTIEYMTFYQNDFSELSSSFIKYKSSEMYDKEPRRWFEGLSEIKFEKLKELDLRACSIQDLSEFTFISTPNLEALYLGENNILEIGAGSFAGLNNLIHLDLSENNSKNRQISEGPLHFRDGNAFENLEKLKSLDFSNTKITTSLNTLRLGERLQRFSLCNAGIPRLPDFYFNQTDLRILDISKNNYILSSPNTLSGLENKLEVLFADKISLNSFYVFEKFNKLEFLKLSRNDIFIVPDGVTKTLTNLKVLDMGFNKITSWSEELFSEMKALRILSVKGNHINLITEGMINDLSNISYIAISDNSIVCNCNVRDFYDAALVNENLNEDLFMEEFDQDNINTIHAVVKFHLGYQYFNKLIENRSKLYDPCLEDIDCVNINTEDQMKSIKIRSKFRILDYEYEAYKCLPSDDKKPYTHFSAIHSCDYFKGPLPIKALKIKTLTLVLTLAVSVIGIVLVFLFKRRIMYFYFTMRNTALLSSINESEIIDVDTTIFAYDVFVSYCDEDRDWVLDHLLPVLEGGSDKKQGQQRESVTVCLHERDFQVGLSILQNIVTSMDRSRSLILVLSLSFLRSQWCQFELHLAHHRLLETRREDLILILLEEIPRRLRSNTLHYLMLSKTYIVWPKEESERPEFWKRVKKSIVTPSLLKHNHAV